MCSKALFYMLGIGWLLLDFLLFVYKKNMTSLVKEQFLSTRTGTFPAFINSHFITFVVWILIPYIFYFFYILFRAAWKSSTEQACPYLSKHLKIFTTVICAMWKWQIKPKLLLLLLSTATLLIRNKHFFTSLIKIF